MTGVVATCKGTIERCIADVDSNGLEAPTSDLILGRVNDLWQRIETEPKTGRWRRRSRLGERKRWYQEPEEA